MNTPSVAARLADLQLLVVTGKGGVGKSTVTAVLGRLLAARGRRTLLMEVDPRENLHHLLEVEPSGGEVVQASPRLWVQHVEPRTILDDLVREKLKVGVLVNRVLSSPIHRHFTEGAPGLKETAVFGRCLRLLRGHTPRGLPRPDVIILDAPATGHGVSWLAAPELVASVISSGPIGQMAEEIAAFLADAAASGALVVTTAEEMPVTETLELIDGLEDRLRRPPEAVVVNAIYPPVPADAEPDPEDVHDGLWRQRRQLAEEELERLRGAWTGPLLHLPLLPLDPGAALVGALGRQLQPQMGGG
jgi:anion-transporting  ArsA/GET3 family ATPase